MLWISRKFTLGLVMAAVSFGCRDDEPLGVPGDGDGPAAYGLLARGRLAVYNGGVARLPRRVKCAMLAWDALEEAEKKLATD